MIQQYDQAIDDPKLQRLNAPQVKPAGPSSAELRRYIVRIVWKGALLALSAGALAFAVVSFLPKQYSSQSYISLSNIGRPIQTLEVSAREIESIIASPIVLDRLLRLPPNTFESSFGSNKSASKRRREFSSSIRFNFAKGGDRKSSDLYLIDADAQSPSDARTLNQAVLNALLEELKPLPARRQLIKVRLQRAEEQLKLITDLTERLEKESTNLVVPGVLGELASPLANLIAQRIAIVTLIENLRQELSGPSEDAIRVVPTLPDEPSWPKPLPIIATAVLAATILSLLLGFADYARRRA
jgi:RNA-binding protein YhbY